MLISEEKGRVITVGHALEKGNSFKRDNSIDYVLLQNFTDANTEVQRY